METDIIKIDCCKPHIKDVLRIEPDYDAVLWDSEEVPLYVKDDGTIDELYDKQGNPIKIPGLLQWQEEIHPIVIACALGDSYEKDWKDYHRRGLEMARQLRSKLPNDYDLWYEAPFEDKSGTITKPILIMENLPFENKEKQVIIFMGIQASGKTTFFNQMLAGFYAHISLDVLHTRYKENLEMTECLERGSSFVIDNTNPEKEDRERYIVKAKEYGYHIIGIFFQSIVRDCVSRNLARENKVPSKAIAATSNKLQMPSMEEGFDELFFARITDNGFDITKWRE